ncbi:MAG: ABC transporter permease [Pirellulaceae bacterium]|nr:ABC transporter permease [Pirellulaceae bacterium]
MFRRRFLPWDYGVRNLMRRPSRTVLTLGALSVVILLVFVVVGFIRGLEQSLSISGDPSAVLIYSMGAEDNIENSSIAARTPGLMSASLSGIQNRFSVSYVSPELYLGTRVTTIDAQGSGLGLVRGVSTVAPLVRRNVKIVEGEWPKLGEVMVGRLVATKLGSSPSSLAIGNEIEFEKHRWRISGVFTALGAAFESEIWCLLPELQQVLKRQDLSLVSILMKPGVGSQGVEIFCKQRTDLELQAISETAYYQSLQKHYKPMRMLGWLVVLLLAGAGVFAGLNMMYGAVTGRIRELATLQAMGYRRRAILVSILQEGLLLSAAGSLIAGVIALIFVNGVAVRFTMGAFSLRVDSVALLIGCGVGLLLGVAGAIPPALKALREPVAQSLKAI